MRRVVPTSRFKRDLKRELKGQYRQLLLADEFIAVHRKFQTRRAAEDSTPLYGEAAQHRMRLSVDGYNAALETLQKEMRHWRKNTATII